MKSRTLAALAVLALTGCAHLPRSLRDDIAQENQKLDQARKDIQRTEATVRDDLSHAPDLFRGTPVATEWPARLDAAKAKLARAEDQRRQLAKFEHAGGPAAIMQAERLISEEHRFRQAALDEAAAVEGEAGRWLDFQRNLPHYLVKMQQEHDQIRTQDLVPITDVVGKAGRDWPAKKPDLDSRLNALRSAPDRAEQQWDGTTEAREAAGSGKATGAQIAALIEADNVLADESADFTRNANELRDMSGQLYNAWDKVLEDLDMSRQGSETIYREKLKTVRTHFADAAAKQGETTSDDRWVDVAAPDYRAVEKDLGMAIAHKDAGLYDSEARKIAQPPGYAYIASPEVGSNQYGYWTHTDQGGFWTFLPEYLILRQLLWGPRYQPIVINEYNNYSSAVRAGRSWYGQESPQAAPKYGSHGTFTQQRYSSSRYVQSGGFKSSNFASRPSSPSSPGSNSFTAPSTQPRSSPTFGEERRGDDSAGRRFGKRSDEPSQGRQFGSSSEGSRPAGKRFGSGSGSRSAPRSFGRRR